jgi:hypothetical protein
MSDSKMIDLGDAREVSGLLIAPAHFGLRWYSVTKLGDGEYRYWCSFPSEDAARRWLGVSHTGDDARWNRQFRALGGRWQ